VFSAACNALITLSPLPSPVDSIRQKQSIFLKGFLPLLKATQQLTLVRRPTTSNYTNADMKFSYAAVAAVMASVAYSQSLSDLIGQLPSCALTCLATASTAGGCGLTDYACQCGPARAGITKSAAPCIASGCSADDATSMCLPSRSRFINCTF